MNNPYLAGNFGPIASEDDIESLAIAGAVPPELAGTYYRNGPNPQFAPRDQHHWFAGDGMVHAFHVANGKVSYRNRYVRTPRWRTEHEAGRSLFGTFGNPMTTDPSVLGQDSGVANTSIVSHGGKLLALEEAHRPFELDPITLEPRGYVELAGSVQRFTAHPKPDPETGELVFFAYGVGDVPLSSGMAYGVVDRGGAVTRLDRFDAPFASMVHDFMVTRSYVLFPIMPLTMSLSRAMEGGPPIAWEPSKGTHVGVLARNGSIDAIQWFTTDACYVFHPMNAWEEGSKIFAHVMQYERAPLFPDADGSEPKAMPTAARLALWTLDLDDASRTVKREYIDDAVGEFPRFDERRAGLPYRHGYHAALMSRGNELQLDTIVHVDHETQKRALYTLPEGDFCGEPVFIPRSEDAPEGDGILLALVYRGREERSDLAFLDASDVAKGPIATARLPRRVPYGFHGNWVADQRHTVVR